RLPAKPRDEFRRKVRTLAGNYQLMARTPAVLLPWRNRLWWQFLSHRALRLVVPWALLALLVAGAASDGPFYRAVLACQLAFTPLGLAGMFPRVGSRSRLAAAIASFLVLNAAAWVAFWVWICGRSSRSWAQVTYQVPAPLARPGHRPAPEATTPSTP